jgi:hypothetical protein
VMPIRLYCVKLVPLNKKSIAMNQNEPVVAKTIRKKTVNVTLNLATR